VAAVAAGWSHCALTTGAGCSAGRELLRQLGDGNDDATDHADRVVGVDQRRGGRGGGGNQLCADDGGGLQCWGFNGEGQLGDGTISIADATRLWG